MVVLKNIFLLYGLALALFGAAVLMGWFAWRLKNQRWKVVAFNLSMMLGLLGAFELALGWVGVTEEKAYWEGSYRLGYSADHPLLGYGPRDPNARVTSRKFYGDRMLYDVTYTLKEGQRHTPNSNEQSDAWALFFGGSFTFGEGLNDDQTLPFFFNEAAGRRYRVRNFGFHGYGPHQALRIVEELVPRDSAFQNAAEKHAFYLLIADHVRRAAGKTSWDHQGPRYQPVGDSVGLAGSFQDGKPWYFRHRVVRRVLNVWHNSNLCRLLFRSAAPEISDADVELTTRILLQMNNLLQRQGAAFHLLVEPDYEGAVPGYDAIAERLQQAGVPVLYVSEVLGNPPPLDPAFYLPVDGHPNAEYNRRVGYALAQTLNQALHPLPTPTAPELSSIEGPHRRSH